MVQQRNNNVDQYFAVDSQAKKWVEKTLEIQTEDVGALGVHSVSEVAATM